MQEYKLLLIYVITVLNITKKRWQMLENYSPIMSRMIKVAQFMMIQLAMQFNNENKEKKERKEEEALDILGIMKKIMNRSMIKNNSTLMQWILD